ncbi:MAG: hypothetical protein ACK5RG_02140 [Cyclobacteriaceae bacterium]|nr:hypothetical protein [Flammeovirgaceae bacterium]
MRGVLARASDCSEKPTVARLAPRGLVAESTVALRSLAMPHQMRKVLAILQHKLYGYG